MDVAKVAKDYFVSSQSSLLIPNRQFGTRKMVHLSRSSSSGSIKLPSPSKPDLDPTVEETEDGYKVKRPPSLRQQLSLPSFKSSIKSASMDEGMQGQDPVFQTRRGKQWLHPADALLRGHILYTTKFLGECAVDQPKGTEVVREAIRKMKFNKHIKRAEGQKPPKVELIISADAVKVIDPKTRSVLHQCPLHRISYCADDKSDKRMFTFIAKAAQGSQHYCYVFDSEKCAEEITLTIGQAFDLAYKRFLETSNSDLDLKKQVAVLKKKVQTLQYEKEILEKRVKDLEKLKDRTDLEDYMKTNQVHDLSTVTLNLRESSTDDDDGVFTTSEDQIPRQTTLVGRRLENLSWKEEAQTNGRHSSTDSAGTPILSPPPANTRPTRANSRANSTPVTTPTSSTNPFLTSPGATTPSNNVDPFGMPVFNPSVSGSGVNSEQEMIDIEAAFSRGLSFGTDDFSLDDLDPLNQK